MTVKKAKKKAAKTVNDFFSDEWMKVHRFK
jgi:hypothetical protein